MKWIALALFIAAVPILTLWLRGNPRQAPWLWGLLSFLPFVTQPWRLSVAPYSTLYWSGYVKGWEFTLLDAVAIAILLGTRSKWPKVYFVVPFAIYIVAVAIGTLQARFPAFALSYLVQVLRAGLVFLAVARVAALEKGERAVLTGLILGLAVQAIYALVSRAGGALQTGGSLGHQNLLGFVSHMAFIPAFAMLLAGRYRNIALLGVVAGLVAVILTTSRATIAFAGVGLALTLFLSLAVRFTGRKALVSAAAIVLVLGSLPFAKASFERRFQQQNTTFFAEDLERDAFKRAAWAIIAAAPMGIGPNHYVFIANTEGYSARAGVAWSSGSRSTNVHNSYLLIAAENGFYGVIAFALLLFSGIGRAFAAAFRFRRKEGSDVLLGLGGALVAVSLHALVEWMAVVVTAQYMLAITLGLVSGIIVRLSQRSASTGPSRRAFGRVEPDLEPAIPLQQVNA